MITFLKIMIHVCGYRRGTHKVHYYYDARNCQKKTLATIIFISYIMIKL